MLITTKHLIKAPAMKPSTPSSSSSSSWVVGVFDRTKRAVLTRFDTEQSARAVYEKHPQASRILLWQPTNPPNDTDDHQDREGDGGGGDDDAHKIIISTDNRRDNNNNSQKIIACSTATWDVDGIGVATLLSQGGGSTTAVNAEAAATTTTSEDEIRRQLANGALPFVPPQRSPRTQNLLKLAMKLFFGRTAVTHFGSAPYRYQSIFHFDLPPPNVVETDGDAAPTKYVALSLDDAPCRFSDRDCSLVAPVQDLLAKYNATATFMLVGRWCATQHTADLVSLLQQGHELANHGMDDRSYEHDDPASFGQAVDECTSIIRNLQKQAGLDDEQNSVPWFRAPHGRYTAEMAAQLEQRNMTNIMCDTYASCPIVQDGAAVAQQLLQTVQNGSIILLHMPEVHVRPWCWTALELLLAGLTKKGYRVVTIGELAKISSVGAGRESVESNARS